MLTREELTKRLCDRTLTVIHESTGIARGTLHDLRNGRDKDYSHSVISRLSAYFEAQEKSPAAKVDEE